MTTRSFSAFAALALALLLAPGCGTKGTTTDDTGTPHDTAGDTGDTGNTTVVPVWTAVSLQTSASVTGIYASGQDEAWITLSGGTAELYQGSTWNDLHADVGGEDLNGVWGAGTGTGATVVAVGNAGYIAAWGSSGWDITDVGTPNFEAIDGASKKDLFAVGWGGMYSNASGDWTYVNIAGNPRFNDIWYNGDVGAVVGEEGLLGLYLNGEWSFTQEDQRRPLYAVSGTGANDIYAVGEAGLVLHWNGKTWEDISPPTAKSIWGVWAATSSAVFVVGNSGLAMERSNGTWTALPTGTDKNLTAVHGTGVNDVWAVGGFGTVLRYQP